MNNLYKYKDIMDDKAKSIKIKGTALKYVEEENVDMSKVLYWTGFKKSKKNKEAVLIDNKIYCLEEFTYKRKVTGYFEVECDNDIAYIAFYKEGILGIILFLIVWAIIMAIILFMRGCKSNEVIDSDPLIPNDVKLEEPVFNGTDFVIGGEDGTDVTLVPEQELSYARYWGYQGLTVDETMKVPFVNKDENGHYFLFIIYDKQGNEIAKSPYIPPKKHWEWDAYSYYNGVPGEYYHDVKVIFCTPNYDENGEIVSFTPGSFRPRTPDFKVTIQ